MNSRQGTNLIHVRRPRPNAWGAPPTATPQELNGNDSTTILHAAKTTTGKPTENHNPRRFIRHKSHAARKTNPENRSGMATTPSCLARCPRGLGISATIALESASILGWRAGMPETRVNSGLAGRLPGNAQSTPTSGQPLKTRINQSLAISLFRWAGASPPCCLSRESGNSQTTGRPRTTNPCRGL